MPVLLFYPAAGVRDHGNLNGLSDDDHSQYALLAPLSTARNTLTAPTATITPLTLKTSDNSPTLPLLDLQTSAGVSVVSAKTALLGNSFDENFIRTNFTFPATPTTGFVDAIQLNASASGAASTTFSVVRVQHLAGYVGGQSTVALAANNLAAGTGSGTNSGNFGINASSDAITTGNNWGGRYTAGNGDRNIGIGGITVTAKNNIPNIGVYGRALNTGTNGVQIAGLFHLSAGYPTLTESAALIADNMATSSPIFLARDNGTKVFEVRDGGAATITLANNASVGLTVKGAASQSANLTEWQDSSGTPIKYIQYDGSTYINVNNFTATTLPNVAGTRNGLVVGVKNTSDFARAAWFAAQNADTTGANAQYYGLNSFVYHTGSANNTSIQAAGFYAFRMTGTNATATQGYGVFGDIFIMDGTPTITDGYSFIARALATTGTITRGYGYYVSNPTKTSGSIGTYYGFYAADISGATTNYAIYTNAGQVRFGDNVIIADAKNVVLDTTTGTKIATATSQKLGFWNATPIVQPTTAVAAATFVANTSGIADDTATFDGYTIGQLAKIIRNLGLAA